MRLKELAKFSFDLNRAKADLILKFLRGTGNRHGAFLHDHHLHPERSPHIRLRPTLQKNSLPIFTGAWYSTHRIRKYFLSRLRQFFLIHQRSKRQFNFDPPNEKSFQQNIFKNKKPGSGDGILGVSNQCGLEDI